MSDQSADHRNDVTLTVRARPAPDVLPRVLDRFARRNRVPDLWASVRAGPGRAHLVFEIEIVGLAESMAERIAASMRQIINVDSVVSSRGAPRSLSFEPMPNPTLLISATKNTSFPAPSE